MRQKALEEINAGHGENAIPLLQQALERGGDADDLKKLLREAKKQTSARVDEDAAVGTPTEAVEGVQQALDKEKRDQESVRKNAMAEEHITTAVTMGKSGKYAQALKELDAAEKLAGGATSRIRALRKDYLAGQKKAKQAKVREAEKKSKQYEDEGLRAKQNTDFDKAINKFKKAKKEARKAGSNTGHLDDLIKECRAEKNRLESVLEDLGDEDDLE